MKKIEMVRVRSSRRTITEIMPFLIDYLREIKASLPENDVKVMHHGLNQGDIAVFIVRQDIRDRHKSREGLLIAEILHEIGALTHSVWLEDHRV